MRKSGDATADDWNDQLAGKYGVKASTRFGLSILRSVAVAKIVQHKNFLYKGSVNSSALLSFTDRSVKQRRLIKNSKSTLKKSSVKSSPYSGSRKNRHIISPNFRRNSKTFLEKVMFSGNEDFFPTAIEYRA